MFFPSVFSVSWKDNWNELSFLTKICCFPLGTSCHLCIQLTSQMFTLLKNGTIAVFGVTVGLLGYFQGKWSAKSSSIGILMQTGCFERHDTFCHLLDERNHLGYSLETKDRNLWYWKSPMTIRVFSSLPILNFPFFQSLFHSEEAREVDSFTDFPLTSNRYVLTRQRLFVLKCVSFLRKSPLGFT